MPKVSVIVTTHNRPRFLQAALHSIEYQTFQDFEIIVADDASTDATKQVVESFMDPRIQHIRHDTRRGEGATRNSGVRHAAGEYVAFLDDDDEWLPRKLEKQLPLLEHASHRVGLVYTGFWKIDGFSKELIGRVLPQKQGAIFQDMWRQNWIGTPSTVILRRTCFAVVGGFDEELAFGADYDMWLRISKEFAVDCVREPLAFYTIHSERMSSSFELLVRGKEKQLHKYERFFAQDYKTYSRRYLSLGVLHCYNNDITKGRKAFRKAIRIDPLEPRGYFNLGLSLLGARRFKKIKSYKEKISPSVSELLS